MLFIWFIKFGLFKPRDEYNIHDYIKSKFCPEYINPEEFDEKERLLRDTPGPAGIKYAYYVGSKVGGVFGSVIAVIALFMPVVAIATALSFAYVPLMEIQIRETYITQKVFNGMHAAVLGVIIAHLYKIIYFNTVNRKSLIIILPSALVFIFLSDFLGLLGSAVLMPFYIAAVIVLGIIFGFVRDAAVRYRIKHPKYINPYSRKAKKLRDRQLKEEELELARYMDDDTIKRRKQEVEEERIRETVKKKYRGEE